MSDERMTDSGDPFQAWIDGLLTSPEAKRAAPAGLRGNLRRALSRKRRRSMARRLVAAAAVVVLICWPRGERVAEDHQLAGTPPTLQQETPGPPVATFVAGDDTIAVEIKSSAPNVTILGVYPTLSARRHREREALLQNTFTSLSYNGG